MKVDYETLERTIKDSAYWYRDLVRTRDLEAVGADWVARP